MLIPISVRAKLILYSKFTIRSKPLTVLFNSTKSNPPTNMELPQSLNYHHRFPIHPTQSLLNLAPEFDPTTKRVVIVTTSTYCIPNPPDSIASLPPHQQPTVLLPNNPTSSSKEPTAAHVITGYSLPDVIYPFNLLRSMGVQVEIASLDGGKVLNDPTTDHFIDDDEVIRSIFYNPIFREMIDQTQPLASYLSPNSTSQQNHDPHRQKKEENAVPITTAKMTKQTTDQTSQLDAEYAMKKAVEKGKLHEAEEMFTDKPTSSVDQNLHERLLQQSADQQRENFQNRPIDALLFAGGYGCMWDFPFNPVIDELARQVYENRKGIIACIGHGSSALLNIHLSNGELLVTGKECTGTSNDEEYNNHRLALYPKHLAKGAPNKITTSGLDSTTSSVGSGDNTMLSKLEDLLHNAEAIYKKSEMQTSFVVVDPPIPPVDSLMLGIYENQGRLITGQNCQSAKEVAEQLLRALSHHKP